MEYITEVLMPEFMSRMVMSIFKLSKVQAAQKIKELSLHLSEIRFRDF